VDEALTRLVEGMLSELKNQIKMDCEEVGEFLTSSQQRLGKRPSTMQEMTEA
jgi:nucleoid DNA-binding protein